MERHFSCLADYFLWFQHHQHYNRVTAKIYQVMRGEIVKLPQIRTYTSVLTEALLLDHQAPIFLFLCKLGFIGALLTIKLSESH